MKNVILVGGTMGVGKTTTCQLLKQKLARSVFLDGDWCWEMHPFQVTDETKAMVMENITFLLNNFIKCSAYENVIFCWVMHQQTILDDILSRLQGDEDRIFTFSLICQENVLQERLEKDIHSGLRSHDIIERSMDRLPLYECLHTHKIDVSDRTPDEAANAIIKCLPG